MQLDFATDTKSMKVYPEILKCQGEFELPENVKLAVWSSNLDLTREHIDAYGTW